MNVGGIEVAGDVSLIADELSRAVELTLNPAVSHDARSQAYTACESFKDNSPWCAQAGLLLASGQYSAVVKHFGLQLMEHTVKYRWTQITQAEKIFIKENAMKLLYMGGWETGHLNDALARVIVEMIKREWPQQWPTLLAELSDACGRGHQHTQIVLHVFLRLVEDVATLQTLEQHQRRKDIYQALTSNMAEIFAFFMRLIELHVQEFREKTAAGDFAAAASNGRVVQVVLLTLTGFVEWVSTNHVVMNNGRLLQILCILLQDDAFQLPAAECLLQIVNRKGSTKERKPLMILFSEDAVSCIHRAAISAISAPPDEHHYLFLKKLSQVMVGLAGQLSSMWGMVRCAEAWLGVLLEATLALAAHASLALAHAATAVWLALLKHDQLARHPLVLAVLPRWLHHAAPKLLKVTYPSRGPSGVYDTAAYASIDYDSEQEFTIFFNRFRTELLESFRQCMMAAPLVTWGYVEQWTRGALEQAARSPPQLDHSHPLYVQWEALAQALDVVLSRLVQAEPRPPAGSGLALLARCVAAEPPHPLMLSLLLSFISALFVFLSCAYSQLAGPGVGQLGAELLPRVLDKVFAALVLGAPHDRRDRHVKNVRRHAAGLLVKLAYKYPLLLLPVFDRLHALCLAAVSRPDLSAVESVTVQEALLLVSNHLCCYERQAALVGSVLGSSGARWAALGDALGSGAGLARLVGLDAPPAAPDADDAPAHARRTLLHALTLLLGVVKRTQVPPDPDKASRGGFGGGTTPSGNPVWRNPCASHALPLLPHALRLARALHELHAPAPAPPLHPAHAHALRPPPAERRNLLALPCDPAPAAPSPADRMQAYVHALHDNCCLLVGAAAASLGRELYATPGLAAYLTDSLLHGLENLPDHWLRPIVRNALKPLLLHCPPAHYQDVALPIIEIVAPFMLTHLTARWEYIASLYESGKLEEEAGGESQEVVEDILVRHLTREYLDLLKVTLMETALSGDGSEMEEETGGGGGGGAGGSAGGGGAGRACAATVSELGALVVRGRAGGCALHALLRALCWPDSGASLRAAGLAGAALRAALAAGRVGAQDASAALGAALHALRAHGQHDANQAALLALLVHVYDALRPSYPHLVTLLRAVPGADQHDLQRLDDKLLATDAKSTKLDKTKRDLFKKITAKLIGRNVGQLFKKEVYIMNLPSLPAPEKVRAEAAEGPQLASLFADAPS